MFSDRGLSIGKAVILTSPLATQSLCFLQGLQSSLKT